MTETRATDQLRPHPLNAQIYGRETYDPRLKESIAADGIIAPLVIDQDDTILAGHRRWGAAQSLGLSHVPVVVREIADPLDGERILIESNRQREKTSSQRQREADELVRILGEQARDRMRAGRSGEWNTAPVATEYAATGNPPPMLGEGLSQPQSRHGGETMERVAGIVGMKRETFRKEREVYQTATGQRPVPAEVKAVAEEQLAKLDAGQTTVNAAAREIAKAKGVQAHIPARREAEAVADDHERGLAALDRHTGGKLQRDRLLRTVENAVNTIATADAATVARAVDDDALVGTFDASITNLERWIAQYRAARADRHRVLTLVPKGA